MTTALNIIEGAARLIGVIRKGEALAADEAADALVSLNDMQASWSNESLLIYTRAWETFTVASGTASYLIGSAQTFNTTRPTKIVAAFYRFGGVDYPLEILSDEQYELNIQIKTLSSIPVNLNYDNGYPYGIIRLYPVPPANDTLGLLSEKVLTSFAALTTTVNLPPGWNKALRYNLAAELAPEYGIKLEPEIVAGAMKSLGAIKLGVSKNRPMPYMAAPYREPNIYSG